jgi:hypothetical protein
MKQQLVSKRRGKLSKGTLFLQDNSAPHKVTIMHQTLADLRFEVLKHADLTLLDYTSFLTSRNTSGEGSPQALWRLH